MKACIICSVTISDRYRYRYHNGSENIVSGQHCFKTCVTRWVRVKGISEAVITICTYYLLFASTLQRRLQQKTPPVHHLNPPDAAGHLVRGGLPGEAIHHLSVGEGHLDGDAAAGGPLGHQGVVLGFELLVQAETLVDVLRRRRQLSRKKKNKHRSLNWGEFLLYVCVQFKCNNKVKKCM